MADKYLPLEAAVAWDMESTRCTDCKKVLGKQFLLPGRRRHHCRACGKCVCSSCSPHLLPVCGLPNVQRVCNACQFDAVEVPSCDDLGFAYTQLPCGHEVIRSYVTRWTDRHDGSKAFPCPMCKMVSTVETVSTTSPNGSETTNGSGNFSSSSAVETECSGGRCPPVESSHRYGDDLPRTDAPDRSPTRRRRTRAALCAPMCLVSQRRARRSRPLKRVKLMLKIFREDVFRVMACSGAFLD